MSVTRWWFQTCLLIFTPSCGKIPISRSIFSNGWFKHQVEMLARAKQQGGYDELLEASR